MKFSSNISSIDITDRGVQYIFSTKPQYYIVGGSYRCTWYIIKAIYSTRTIHYGYKEISFRIIKTM